MSERELLATGVLAVVGLIVLYRIVSLNAIVNRIHGDGQEG